MMEVTILVLKGNIVYKSSKLTCEFHKFRCMKPTVWYIEIALCVRKECRYTTIYTRQIRSTSCSSSKHSDFRQPRALLERTRSLATLATLCGTIWRIQCTAHQKMPSINCYFLENDRNVQWSCLYYSSVGNWQSSARSHRRICCSTNEFDRRRESRASQR